MTAAERLAQLTDDVAFHTTIAKGYLRTGMTTKAAPHIDRIRDVCHAAFDEGLLPALHAEIRRRGFVAPKSADATVRR